jgi:hypothetical protein
MLLTHSELQHSLLVIEILPSTKVMYAKTYSKKKFLWWEYNAKFVIIIVTTADAFPSIARKPGGDGVWL